jgi:hypothetical protein
MRKPIRSAVPFHPILYSPKHTLGYTQRPVPTFVLFVRTAHKAAGLADSQDTVFGGKDSAHRAVAHVPTAGNLADFVTAFERSHRLVSFQRLGTIHKSRTAVDARTGCGKVVHNSLSFDLNERMVVMPSGIIRR